MRKIFLIMALLLVGTNTEAKTVETNYNNPVNNNKVEVISFVQDNILYKVSTTGTFNFEVLSNNTSTKRKQRKKKNKVVLPKIVKNHNGNVIQIGTTSITYKGNGQVKQIGRIPLFYDKGLLIQIGGLDIFYNGDKRIYDTSGDITQNNTPTYVNGVTLNKKEWKGYNITKS